MSVCARHAKGYWRSLPEGSQLGASDVMVGEYRRKVGQTNLVVLLDDGFHSVVEFDRLVILGKGRDLSVWKEDLNSP